MQNQVYARVSEEQLQEIERLAAARNVSKADVMRELLEFALWARSKRPELHTEYIRELVA